MTNSAIHVSTIVALFSLAACGSNSSRSGVPGPSATTQATSAKRDLSALVEKQIPDRVQVRGEERYSSLEERMRFHRVPGVSIAVFENHKIIWAKGYGTAAVGTDAAVTTETMFQAASISKPVNAMLTLRIAQAGRLSIDAPVNQLLRSWTLPDNELTKKTPVTIRHLLSHTAGTTVHGFGGYPTGTPTPTIAQVLSGKPPANSSSVTVDIAPGSQFRYSGGGTSIVQQALVDVLATAYPGIANEWVLGPLGMSNSTFEQPLPAAKLGQAAAAHGRDGSVIPTQRHVYPEMAAAGLWTTPSDLARFFIAIAKARNGLESPVEKEVAALMTAPVAPSGESGAQVSLGTFLGTHSGVVMFGHGGANEGFRCIGRASIDGGYGFVIMTNSDNGGALADEIERALFSRDGWPGIDPPIERVAADATLLERANGRYIVRGGPPFEIASASGRLEFRRPFEEPVELVPVVGGELVLRNDGGRVVVDPQGKVLTFTAPKERGGQSVVAQRIGDDVRVPLLLLAEGRFDDAVSAWREVAHTEPGSPAMSERALNQLGYRLLGRQDNDRALVLFRFITVVSPESSNAFDSLGEAHAIRGETDKAIAAYQAAIDKIDADKAIPEAQRPARRKHAEDQIAKLRKP